jgi:hypothetical protein
MFFLSKRNRRTEPRSPATAEVSVTLLRSARTLNGKMIDSSQSGLGLLLDEFVMFRTPVEVHWQGGGAFGEVQHCRSAGGRGYVAGVKIQQWIP